MSVFGLCRLCDDLFALIFRSWPRSGPLSPQMPVPELDLLGLALLPIQGDPIEEQPSEVARALNDGNGGGREELF